MANKYSTYKVLVIGKEGQEEITLGGINTNYRSMLEVYRHAKETLNTDDVYEIQFVGVTDGGELKVFFSKSYDIKEKTPGEEKIEEQKDKDTYDIMWQIRDLLKDLKEKRTNSSAILGSVDKQINVEMHRIESLEYFKGDKMELISEKLNIIDSIEELTHKRRRIKNGAACIDRVVGKTGLSLDRIIKLFDVEVTNKKIEYLSDKKAEELEIIKKITYVNDIDRCKKVKNLNKRYTKVVNDEENQTLICYNKAKSAM